MLTFPPMVKSYNIYITLLLDDYNVNIPSNGNTQLKIFTLLDDYNVNNLSNGKILQYLHYSTFR